VIPERIVSILGWLCVFAFIFLVFAVALVIATSVFTLR
jgi:hypothetical protein